MTRTSTEGRTRKLSEQKAYEQIVKQRRKQTIDTTQKNQKDIRNDIGIQQNHGYRKSGTKYCRIPVPVAGKNLNFMFLPDGMGKSNCGKNQNIFRKSRTIIRFPRVVQRKTTRTFLPAVGAGVQTCPVPDFWKITESFPNVFSNTAQR
jgi:hypothetical protein